MSHTQHATHTQVYKRAVDLIHEGMDGNVTISVDVKHLKVFVRLSKLLRRFRRFNEAQEILKKMISRMTGRQIYPNIYAELAEVLVKMGNMTEAKVYINQALRQEPKHTQSHVALARMHAELGDKGQAEKVLRGAVKTISSNSILLYELAALLQANHHGNKQKIMEAETL